jgi:glycosyltransferase involved in cell wall biosynthesis
MGSLDHRWRRFLDVTAPVRGRAGYLRARVRLFIAAVARRRHLPRRRRRLGWKIDGLRPAGSVRANVGIVVFGSPGSRGDAGGEPATVALARRAAEAASSNEMVCFLAWEVEPLESGWLERLAAPIGGLVVASTAMVLHPERPPARATPHDLLIRQVGLELRADASGQPTLASIGAGEDPAFFTAAAPPSSASRCLLVDRAAYERIGGLSALADEAAAVIELGLRLVADGGRIATVPDAVLVDRSPVASVRALTHPLDASGETWREIVGAHGPALRRAAAGGDDHLRVAITTAATPGRIAGRWGDWELAQGLGRALRRRGAIPYVQTSGQVHDLAGRTADVRVVVRGLLPVERTSGQGHVLWVISHPEEVDREELDAADLVLAASGRLAAHLATITTTPVEVLLQGTDHRRFRPHDPSPAHSHAVTIVANTRGVFRPVVADAIAAGLHPAVYGDGWDRFIDRTLIVRRHVPNAELPVVYSSAGVVLNDHWVDMSEWGMVSNRVYDVLACGTPIVSDRLPEISEQFGDLVPMYTGPAELAAVVGGLQMDPAAATERAAAARRVVLEHHTLDHRAGQLLDALARHDLLPEP